MRCVIRISPHGRFDIIQPRYITGIQNVAYPATIDNVAVVGVPVRLVSKAPNYTATCLINRAINAVLDGYAYIYKSSNGLNNLQAFTKTEAESLIKTCIQQVGGKTA